MVATGKECLTIDEEKAFPVFGLFEKRAAKPTLPLGVSEDPSQWLSTSLKVQAW